MASSSRRKRVLERGHAHDHARVGVPAAAESGSLRLLVGGEAFDHPRRGEDVGEEVGRAPQELPPEAHDPARLVEVDDVGELVGEDEAQPAFVVAELVAAVGSDRAHVDERIRERRREAVRVVLVVREDDVHAAHPVPVARLVPLEDVRGEDGRLARRSLQPLVEVHRHPLALERPEAVARREVRGVRRRAQQEKKKEKGGKPAGELRHSTTEGNMRPAALREVPE